MDPLAEPFVVLRLRMDQRVESVDNLAVTHNDDPDRADAGRAFVGSLEVYGREGRKHGDISVKWVPTKLAFIPFRKVHINHTFTRRQPAERPRRPDARAIFLTPPNPPSGRALSLRSYPRRAALWPDLLPRFMLNP